MPAFGRSGPLRLAWSTLPALLAITMLGALVLVPDVGAARAASGTLDWWESYDLPPDGSYWDEYVDAAAGPNGTMYAAGSVGAESDMKATDISIVRYRETLANDTHEMWRRQWDKGADDRGQALTTDADGNAIVAGTTSQGWAILKYSPQGVKVWEAIYSPVPAGRDWVSRIACDRAGNVYVCGANEFSSGTHADWIVAKFRATNGSLAWKRIYSGFPGSGAYHAPTSIAVDRLGQAYVTGSSTGYRSISDILVMKLGRGGAIAWTKRIDGTSQSADQGDEIALHDGAVFVTGASMKAGTQRIVAARFTTAGTRVWLRSWSNGSGTSSTPWALTFDGADHLVIGGTTDKGSPDAAVVLSWDSGGGWRWARSWRDAEGRNARFVSVTANASGAVWAAGVAGSWAGGADGIIARFQPNGTRAWARVFKGYESYNGAGDEWFTAVRLWGRTGLFAAGFTTNSTVDQVAAKYTR